MDAEQVCAILNELLASAQRAVAPRLFESTVFASRLAVAELPLAQRIAHQTQRHAERLTTLILEYGGVPGPRIPDPTTASLHYQDLHYALPALIADLETLTRKYRVAAKRLASEPRAAALVGRILTDHERAIDELKRLRQAAAQTTAP